MYIPRKIEEIRFNSLSKEKINNKPYQNKTEQMPSSR